MLTGTTLAAIRMLVFLSHQEPHNPISPRRVAETIGESPTYLAKVANTLTKAGILRSHRGVTGGMTLAVEPQEVSLLAVYEACQGRFIGDFCQDVPEDFPICAFHHAMKDLYDSVSMALSRWTLEDLRGNPFSAATLDSAIPCRMAPIQHHHPIKSEIR